MSLDCDAGSTDHGIELDGRGPQTQRARSWARQVLEGCLSVRELYDVLLVVTELVANAHLHGGRPRRLRLTYVAEYVRIEVDDASQAPPSEPGLGLTLVDRLAKDWGSTSDAGGKTVWADVEHGHDCTQAAWT